MLSGPTRRLAASARGMSIVELMIGVAIGLFILAGAIVVVTGQLSENRRVLADTRIQQDLRAAADIISHDVRRAGYHDLAYTFVSPAANPTAAQFNQASAYAAMTPASGPATQVVYSFSQAPTPGVNGVRTAPLPAEISGFGYNADHKTIEMRLGDGGWQALTDPASVLITSFTITVNSWDQAVPCAQLCPAVGPNGRALNLSTRNVVFTIVGQSATDPNVVRSLSTTVRVRNDIVWEAP